MFTVQLIQDLPNLTVFNGENLYDEEEEEEIEKKEVEQDSLQSATQKLREDSKLRQELVRFVKS